MLLVNNRVDTDETATSVLEHQSHAAGNEAITEEDEGTEANASAAAAAATTVTQSPDSDTVLNNNNNLRLITVKTNRSTLHTIYNIQQSAMQGSNDTTHRLSRRTAATIGFSPETRNRRRQGYANIRSGGPSPLPLPLLNVFILREQFCSLQTFSLIVFHPFHTSLLITALTIHHSFVDTIHAKNSSVPQILPTIHCCYPTHWTNFHGLPDCFFEFLWILINFRFNFSSVC